MKARARWPELALLSVGVLLRLTALWRFDPGWSYDAGAHLRFVGWWRTHDMLAPRELMLESFHPPLWYWLAARLHLDARGLQALAVACGSGRLIALWIGLEQLFPTRPLTRRLALALAAVLPASVMSDGMLGAEPLLGFESAVLLALVVPLYRVPAEPGRAQHRRRWALALAVGLGFGIALLTKVSALTLIGAFGLGALADVARGPGELPARLHRQLPLVAGLGVCVLVCGWYYADNVRHFGKPFLTSFDAWQHDVGEKVRHVPYWKRRPPGYFFTWSTDVNRQPLYDAGTGHFWPVLLATTFGDYYNYGYSPRPDPKKEPSLTIANRPIAPRALPWMRLALVGGMLIALTVLLAWLAALWPALRSREPARVVLLAVPLLALGGAMHFAVSAPLDHLGVIKGSYLQYASLPLSGLYGLAIDWSWARRSGRWLALLPLAGLALVAAYTLFARLA